MSGALVLLAALSACGGPVSRGEAALAAEDLLTAETEFRRALDAEPDDPDALYGIGWTFHLAGEKSAAKDAFVQLADTHPERPDGFRGTASVLLASGDLPGARAQLTEAERVAPADPAVMQSWVILELASGDAEAALVRADAGVAAHPEASGLLQVRAAALLTMGRVEEARAAAAAAVAGAEGKRELAAARITWVDSMIREADGRVDPERCGETAPPVQAWLAAADGVLDEVEAGGAHRAQLVEVRKQVRRRRAYVEDLCTQGGK